MANITTTATNLPLLMSTSKSNSFQRRNFKITFLENFYSLTLRLIQLISNLYLILIKKIKLFVLQTQQTREVLHYHYTSWPDFGLPESPASFLDYLEDVRKSGAIELNDFGPPVIHCSAGIGRSGTLCLVDSCLIMVYIVIFVL
jgi:tyrosine-protein phosphatase non-receptor type 1